MMLQHQVYEQRREQARCARVRACAHTQITMPGFLQLPRFGIRWINSPYFQQACRKAFEVGGGRGGSGASERIEGASAVIVGLWLGCQRIRRLQGRG